MLAQVATSVLLLIALGLGTADYASARVPRPRASVCNGYSEVLPSSLHHGNFLLTIRAVMRNIFLDFAFEVMLKIIRKCYHSGRP